MRRLVVGDIHGAYKALIQVLERVKFNPDTDLLIGIGDYVDGYPESKKVVQYLIDLKDSFIGVIGNHDCHSSDTEVLTNRGWVTYNNIYPTDKILSFSVSKNKAVWDKINNIIIKPFEGVLFNLKTQNCDMLITKGHRILGRDPRKKDLFSYHTIEEGLPYYLEVPTNGIVDLPDVDLPDEIIQLLGWAITDGSIFFRKKSTKIHLYQSKPDMVDRIISLLEKGNISYKIKKRERQTKEICGVIIKKQFQYSYEFYLSSASVLSEVVKDVYRYDGILSKLSKRQFNLFLHECILADGTYYNRKENSKTSMLHGKEEVLNLIQAMGVQKGFQINKTKNNRGHFKLNICERSGTQFYTNKKIKEVPYSGVVWCLSVPETNFMVRRNGKVFFSGNCWTRDWMKRGGQPPSIWTSQGGNNTLKSYNHKSDKEHLAFLESLPKYIELDNKLFVHGGYNPDIKETIEEQAKDKPYYDIESDLTWDRVLFMNMFYPREPWYKGDEGKNITYDKVFIGHTTTERIAKGYVPLFSDKVVAIDTGAGWAGKLTVMDIDTLEYWQSDETSLLYPEERGR
jgi:serine/threonine protein phosphatase 1